MSHLSYVTGQRSCAYHEFQRLPSSFCLFTTRISKLCCVIYLPSFPFATSDACVKDERSTDTFCQTFHPSSLQPSLSAPSSTKEFRSPFLRLSLVIPITGLKPQTPRRSSSNPRRPPVPLLPGVQPSSVAPFSLTVLAP